MKARGAAVIALVAMVLLMAFASYLLDIPAEVVLIGAAFAIGVILWIASRTRGPAPRSSSAIASPDAKTILHTNSRPKPPSFDQNEGFSNAPEPENPPVTNDEPTKNRE